MEPTYQYVALLDVLAYRNHLAMDRKTGRLDFKENLSSVLSMFENVDQTIFHVQAISDTIILSCVDHANFPQFLRLLQNVFVNFLSRGLFIRGGIAYSLHFHENYITYSHGIALAHELESNYAIYPRIVIDTNIIQMYDSGVGLPTIHNNELLCKENGIYFLNILTKDNWTLIYEYAKTIFNDYLNSSDKTEDAFQKHFRFQHYVLTSPYSTRTVPYIDPISHI
jgi:hypothetical protein